jgi:hypothetical protein
MPGAGKTTISARLAARFDYGVHVPGDAVHDIIVGGRVEPDGALADEAKRQIALTQHNMCTLALTFSDAAFVPVIDWVVRDRPDLDTFRKDLRGRHLHLIVLEPGPDVPDILERFSYLQPTMERELGDVGLHIDTGAIGVDATLEQILSHRRDALIEALR